MKKFMVILSLFLCGCSKTVYVPQMPEIPKTLEEKCGDLEQIESEASTQDAVKTIANNYMKYHECSDKVDLWQEWYKKQKSLIGDTKIK